MTFRTFTGIIVIAIATWLPPAEPAAQLAPAGRIAYESCYFDNWDTFSYLCSIAVLADGTETVVAPLGYSPKWSPDGGRIVFVGAMGAGSIKVVNLADLTVYNVTSDPASDRAPAWSPDGSTIAFVSDRAGTPELYRVNADGTGLVRLTTAIGFNGRFAWSPDGRTIALARDVGGVADLYRINADGSGIVRLTSGPGGIGEFDWSSDGTRIVFDCASVLCVINADGTGSATLTTISGRDAVFAPGDGRIAFVTPSAGPAPEIAVRHEDGTIVRVAPGTSGTNPVWSPDGTSLLFEGTDPISFEGCCANACNADTYCTPVYGLYSVSATGSNLQSLGKGANPDWLRERAGQPVASFTYQCAGASCAFDATGSADPDGAIAGYAWSWGDGTTGTGATSSHVYFPGGTFTVTLSVTDNEGITTSVSRRVVANAPETVNHPPVASFATSCDAVRCTFDASASADPEGRALQYAWNFGDGSGLFGSAIQDHVYGAPGIYRVALIVADDAGQQGTFDTTIAVQSDAMHVGDLDGVTTPGPKATSTLNVTVAVHGSDHRPVSSARVTGWWSSGQAGECSTDGTGRCTVTTTLRGSPAGVSFTIQTAEHTAYVYRGPNHDPDADSNGTTITFKKR